VIPLPTIAAYASIIAGQPTAITCDIPAASPYDGYVNFTPDLKPIPVIHLRPGLCLLLTRADSNSWVSPAPFLVLEHEAQHIALASLNECVVERTALQNIWQLVRLFRLAAWRTQAILAGVAFTDASMPNAYHPDATGAC
jgi:hypothetical protein